MMTDAEKDELLTIKHRVRGALAGFEELVVTYEEIDEPDEFTQGKLEAYRLTVTRLKDITEK